MCRKESVVYKIFWSRVQSFDFTNILWYCYHLMLSFGLLSCVNLQYIEALHLHHKDMFNYEGLNTTRLTRTLCSASGVSSSEFLIIRQFIYLHTHGTLENSWVCVCIWCVLQATTVRMGALHKPFLTLTLPVLQKHKLTVWWWMHGVMVGMDM